MILGLTYGFLPFMILPLYASIERMDKSLVEASYDLGHGKASTLFRVIIPTVSPGLVAGVLLVFIPAVGDFVTPELLGGVKTQMIGNTIDDQFGQRQELAARLGDVGAADGLHPRSACSSTSAASGRTRCEHARARSRPALPQAARVPRVRVPVRADHRARRVQLQPGAAAAPTGPASRRSWYHDLLHNDDALQAFRNTLKVAFIATIVATVIGTLAAFALTRFKFRGRAGYSTLVFISLVMPEIVHGHLAARRSSAESPHIAARA